MAYTLLSERPMWCAGKTASVISPALGSTLRIRKQKLALVPPHSSARLRPTVPNWYDRRVSPPPFSAPIGTFVGREVELAALYDAFNSVLSGRGQFVLVSGEPGIGKTRLADECAAVAQQQGVPSPLGPLLGRGWCTGVLAVGPDYPYPRATE